MRFLSGIFYSRKILTLLFFLGKDAKDFYDLNSVIIRELIQRFNDENKDVVKTANKAFLALSKCVPAEVLVEDIEYMKNLIASMVSDARRRKGGVGDGEFLLPGFNIPKGRCSLSSFLLCMQYEAFYFLNTISTSNVGCQRLVFLIANESYFLILCNLFRLLLTLIFRLFLIQVLSHSFQFIREEFFMEHLPFGKHQLLGLAK